MKRPKKILESESEDDDDTAHIKLFKELGGYVEEPTSGKLNFCFKYFMVKNYF